jgi:hypothetical protein
MVIGTAIESRGSATKATLMHPTSSPLQSKNKNKHIQVLKQHRSLRVQHISVIARHHEYQQGRWQAHHLHRLRCASTPISCTLTLIPSTLTIPSIALLLVRLHQHQKIPPTPQRPRRRSRHPPILPRRCPRCGRQPFRTDTAMETSVLGSGQ